MKRNPFSVLPSEATKSSSLRVVWQVGGSSNSVEVGASGWLADPEALALARFATRARASSLGRASLRSEVE